MKGNKFRIGTRLWYLYDGLAASGIVQSVVADDFGSYIYFFEKAVVQSDFEKGFVLVLYPERAVHESRAFKTRKELIQYCNENGISIEVIRAYYGKNIGLQKFRS